MRLLIDTNILLDVLQTREPHFESSLEYGVYVNMSRLLRVIYPS